MWLFYPKPCISVSARELLTLSPRLGRLLPSACREINVYKWNSTERQSHSGFIKNPLQNVLVLYPAEQQSGVYTSWLWQREQHPVHFKCVKCGEEDHQVLPLHLGAVRGALLLSNNPKGWDAAAEPKDIWSAHFKGALDYVRAQSILRGSFEGKLSAEPLVAARRLSVCAFVCLNPFFSLFLEPSCGVLSFCWRSFTIKTI